MFPKDKTTNIINLHTKIMKKLTTFILAALCTFTANAQTTWNFSDWTAEVISSTKTKDGLTVAASSGAPVTIDKSAKKIDSYSFTQRMKLGGSGKSDSRYVSFNVSGNSEITVYAISSNSTDTRTMNFATGSFDNVVSTASVGTSIAKYTFNYSGSATTIYIYSAKSGLNLYAIISSATAAGGGDQGGDQGGGTGDDDKGGDTGGDTGGNTGGDQGGNTGMSGLSAYDANKPLGWGYETTGSGDKNPVLVSNESDLNKYAKAGGYTLYIDGTINVDASVTIGSNTTIYGLPGATIQNLEHRTSGDAGIFNIKNQNIIIRNLTLKGAGAYDRDGTDPLHVAGATNLWVDHCDVQDGIDGNLDITNAADKISVTWTRFRYLIAPMSGGSGGAKDHRNTNLIGASDNSSSDKGKLRTTFVSCWWDAGCHERNPRVRYGKVHVANCLYGGDDFSYCIGYGVYANIYADHNDFHSSAAQKKYAKGYANGKPYNLMLVGNLGVKDINLKSGSETQFEPYKEYAQPFTPYDADKVYDAVTDANTGAGPTLDIKYGSAPTTAIEGVTDEAASIVSTKVYSISGALLSEPQRGLNIIVNKMSDGTVKTQKVMIR